MDGDFRQRVNCVFIFGLLLLFCAANLQAQTTTGFITEHNRNRIQRAVDEFVNSHKYHLGFLRIQPIVNVSAGFSTNSRYGTSNQNNKADFYFRVAPSISAGVKFGSRAFVKIAETYTLHYQATRKDLQYNFGATNGEFVTGSPRLLARLSGSYYRRIEPVNEEITQPVDNIYASGRFGVDYAATYKLGLHHSVGLSGTRFEEQVSGNTIPLEDRKTFDILNGASFAFNERYQFTGDLRYSRSLATNSDVKTDRWDTLFGLNYRRPKFSARIGVGYSASKDSSTDNTRRDFILNSNVNFLFRRSMHLGFSANRYQEYSYLANNAVRTTTAFGATYGTPVFKRLSVYSRYNIGKSDYGNQPIGGQIVNNDTFQDADVGANFRIYRNIGFNAGITYYDHTTDIPGLDQNHFNYYFGLGLGYTVNLLDLFL